MAEAKKDPEKEKAEAREKEIRFFSELFFVIIGLLLLSRFITFRSSGGPSSGTGGGDWSLTLSETLDRLGIGSFFYKLISAYVTFANILSLIFAVTIVYCLVRIIQIQRQWYAKLYPVAAETQEAAAKNARWQTVVQHVSSGNPSDWRLAILECDIILDELLDRQNYVGDTIGDKLKQADKGEFRTLDSAWEAHKIRNAIAHEGQNFVLTEREARRIVGLYETVFREFDFV